MHRGRMAMTKKHWMQLNIIEAAKAEDQFTAKLMNGVADDLRKCGSRTIFEVAHQNHERLCRKDSDEGKNWRERKLPEAKESVEWKGEGDHNGALATLGLAKCKRIQCPLCCFARSYLRRKNALDWAQEINWKDYYCVALTFTVPHKLSDSSSVSNFKKKLEILKSSLKSFGNWNAERTKTTSRGYKSPCPSDIGYVASMECTFGKNGLHPHFHALFFTKSESDVDNLRKWFRRNRVKVWTSEGKKVNRMPEENEDKSFQVLVKPKENAGPEKILSYINKGLFETISVDQKQKAKGSSKNIFNLSKSELKYFCIFFEATRGLRFYRSGGICKQIRNISEQVEEWENGTPNEIVNKQLDRICRLSQKDDDIPRGWISDFVKKRQVPLEQQAVHISPKEIRKLVNDEWTLYYEKRKEFEDCFAS